MTEISREETSKKRENKKTKTGEKSEKSEKSARESLLDDSSAVLLSESPRFKTKNEFAGEMQWEERESRNRLKHVEGLGELQDVTEVEYRKVRLEKVVLAGVWSNRETTLSAAEESLRELAALAKTAGAIVADGVLQHRLHPDPATYVGSGKAREIAGIVAATESDTIVVDADLAPSQRRALEVKMFQRHCSSQRFFVLL